MTRARKTAAEVRAEAYRLVRAEAVEREKTGDPEGAGVLRDLARDIKAIRLTQAPRSDL